MILEETINRLIRDVVDLIVGTDGFAIKSKQLNAPRPIGSYADVDFVTDTSIGWEYGEYENREEDPDLNRNTYGMREIMISVGFYRSGSMDYARRVRSALVRESIQELFREAGLGLIRRSNVREISTALENGWEDRSQFDIFISAVGSDTEIVRSIESMQINAKIEHSGSIYNTNIHIGE